MAQLSFFDANRRLVRTIGIVPEARLRHDVRARAKIGLQNLAYDIRRLVTLEACKSGVLERTAAA